MSSVQDTILRNAVNEGILVMPGKGDFRFFVIKRDMEPRLRNFLGITEDGLLFISEDTPRKWRGFCLAHEVFCVHEGGNRPGRCVQAIKQELELVPPEDREEYIKFRASFFEELVEFISSSPNEEFKKEIKASLDHLRSLLD